MGAAANNIRKITLEVHMLKLAFLFLTIGNLNHEEHWKDFLNGYEHQYSLYVHAKNKKNVTSPFLKPYVIPETVQTSWSHTMKAQIALLKEALKDPQNGKFVFLSESTIPLQNFAKVYRVLFSTPKSIFKTQPNPHLNIYTPKDAPHSRMVPGIQLKYQQKHSQWIVLNRKHAALLVASAKYLKKRPVYCDNEHYPGTVIAFKRALRDEVSPYDTTYVNWDRKGPNGRAPFTFSNLKLANEKELVLKVIKHGYLFARKFSPRCFIKELDEFLLYRNPSRLETASDRPLKRKKAKKLFKPV